MYFEKDKFQNFHKHKKDGVVIGDNFMLEVHGIESSLIHNKVIENVFYVPKLRMSILSFIKVARKGYSSEFTFNSWSTKKGLATLLKGSITNGLYIVDQEPTKMCQYANQMLGHINHKNIQLMKIQNLMEGFPSITPTISIYESCILGKMKRKNFEKDKATRAIQIFHLIHSDLMSPFQAKSLGGAFYVFTFIDNFNRMTFGHLLEHKD